MRGTRPRFRSSDGERKYSFLKQTHPVAFLSALSPEGSALTCTGHRQHGYKLRPSVESCQT